LRFLLLAAAAAVEQALERGTGEGIAATARNLDPLAGRDIDHCGL